MTITELLLPDFLKDFDINEYKGTLWNSYAYPAPPKRIGVRLKINDPFNLVLSFGPPEVEYCRVCLRDVPAGNCGVMEMSHPRLQIYQADFLKYTEAFVRSKNRSVLIGNDAFEGATWLQIKNHGENYKFIKAGWNRNYDNTNRHRVGLYYKDIGEESYPNIYGLGKEFPAPKYDSNGKDPCSPSQ